MNNDRGIIKWLPFNSVISGKKVVYEILKEKNKITMPLLSEEQQNNNEQNIINHYYEHTPIKIEYFYNGEIYKINNIIKKIDFTYHKIYFENTILYFNQIINTN